MKENFSTQKVQEHEPTNKETEPTNDEETEDQPQAVKKNPEKSGKLI